MLTDKCWCICFIHHLFKIICIMFAPGYAERLLDHLLIVPRNPGSLWDPVNWFQCSQHSWSHPINSQLNSLPELCYCAFFFLWHEVIMSAVLNDIVVIMTILVHLPFNWLYLYSINLNKFQNYGKRKMYVLCIVTGFSSIITVFNLNEFQAVSKYVITL